MIRLVLFLISLPLGADAACRQALAFGLDVSGSVDAAEYRLQLDGLAAALNSEKVKEVFFAQPDAPIRISIYEWSGPIDQTIILPWVAITSSDDLADVTEVLQGHQRSPATPTTAIGAAMLTGFMLLRSQTDCWKRSLDISGDGPANTGPRPQDIKAAQIPPGVIVNGLVIGSGNQAGDDQRFADIKELSSYYRNYVIRGPGAGCLCRNCIGFR